MKVLQNTKKLKDTGIFIDEDDSIETRELRKEKGALRRSSEDWQQNKISVCGSPVLLQSLKRKISCLFRARNSLTFRQL